jgi:hypothetical protein
MTGVFGAVVACLGEEGIRGLTLAAEEGRFSSVSDTDDFERGRVSLNLLTGVVISTPLDLSRERQNYAFWGKSRERSCRSGDK